jgi:hypothetical protein
MVMLYRSILMTETHKIHAGGCRFADRSLAAGGRHAIVLKWP